jgi:hypothetical protein
MLMFGTTFKAFFLREIHSVLKTIEPKLTGFTGLMADQFKPTNKPNRSASL